MPGALSNYRIVELGDHPTIAVLGMLLADQGADVVKVEPPGGDPMRGSPVFSVWNRAKRSVTIDPDGPDGPEVAHLRRILRHADVVIESFSSGVNPYGVDAAEARSVRPDVIHLSLPGFGETHPQAATPGPFPGHELLISAATGVYADRSPDSDEGASFIALPYASIFGAMVAAPAIVAALFHRERAGAGQAISIPLYDAMFSAMGSALVRRPDVPAAPAPLSPAIGRFYRCGDGRWINLNATYERSLRPILDVLGHPDWYAPLTDDRLRVNVEERDEWAARFAETWLDRPALEWETLMADAGVPLTMCRTLREWMDTDHAWASGAIIEVQDAEFGPMRQVGIQVNLSDTPGGAPKSAPRLGEHNNELLPPTERR